MTSLSRRALLLGGTVALAGCSDGDGGATPAETDPGETPPPTDEPTTGGIATAAPGGETAVEEGFEGGLDWATAAAIGPKVDVEAFEWAIERSGERAHSGDWSLRLFTEGDYDGTAWAVRPAPVEPGRTYRATVSAWARSESESFNTLRHLVASLGPERPTAEADFPASGTNTTGTPDASAGGLREPLHRAEG